MNARHEVTFYGCTLRRGVCLLFVELIVLQVVGATLREGFLAYLLHKQEALTL